MQIELPLDVDWRGRMLAAFLAVAVLAPVSAAFLTAVLPLTLAASMAWTAIAATRAARLLSFRRSYSRVLIMDDEAAARSHIEVELTRNGFEVTAVASPSEALKHA